MRKPMRGMCAATTVAAVVLAGFTTVTVDMAGASTKAPITIALISSTTGPAGPQYARAPQGFLARIALQNAQGGVNGHKINGVVVNDAGNYTEESSIVQGAVQTKGAIGVVSVTPFMFEAYRWLQQNHIPVTGASSDGPEWGQPQNTNMFPADTPAVQPNSPATAALSKVMLAVGAKNVSSIGYSISPLSSQAAKNFAASAEYVHIKAPYVNTSVTYGATDFTSEALAIKNAGSNFVAPSMDDNSNFALMQDLRNAGSKAKGMLATGLEPTVIGSGSWPTLLGSYFFQVWKPSQLKTKTNIAMQSALKKYEHVPTKTFPDWAVYESWVGATLMIKGLQLDGPNPTSQGIISKLRKVTNFTGNNLLARPINYATIMKTYGPSCLYLVKAVQSGFTPVSTKAICGTAIPGTGTTSG
ncbi:MAG: ABC transporter substrate-binding protein [Acidimicrobiales bacterium]